MNLRTLTWKAVAAARAVDIGMTRRDGRRTILIDSRTSMNYVMAAPIHMALGVDPRVQFYATASESPLI